MNIEQPDQRSGMEERWRAVFDQVFGELRTNHPADEWTFRLVDQLITTTQASTIEEVSPPTPEPAVEVEPINKEAIKSETATEQNRAVGNEGENVEQACHPAAVGHDMTDGESTEPETNQQIETDREATSSNHQEKAAETESLETEEEQQPVAGSDANPPSPGHEDNQVDAALVTAVTEIQVDQVQAVQLHSEPAVDQTAAQEGEINDSVDKLLVESGSDAGLEAQGEQHVETEREREPALDHDGEKTVDTVESEKRNEQSEPEMLHQDIPTEQQQEINETLAVLDAAANETHSAESDEPAAESNDAHEDDKNQPDPVVQTENDKAIIPQDSEVAISDSDELADSRADSPPEEQAIHINGESSVAQGGDVQVKDLKDDESATNYEERLINDQDHPNQVEEVEVVPVQISPARPAQRLGASSPQLATNGDGHFPASASAVKKSPAKNQENELVRKPEWMRRPLVRKGSVGRFLGRMKETMQSKRFHPDRLPVVPPPQPEPPKRPPRRKTLANLDLSRDSETFNREQNSFNSTAPATPKTAPASEFETKSATLRSNASDRKRKNSVGRFIGRVLSTKHLNATDGTAAEEAPLLQQNPQPVPDSGQQQQAHSPTTQRSSTPVSADKSIKGQAVMAVNDMGILIRRILRPKTAANEESKEKSSPQRPPLPAHQQRPAPIETNLDTIDMVEEKPVMKTGKVHFQCQTCHHEWKSVRGIARCEINVHQVGDGIRQGEIAVRLYGQQCKRCTSNVFELAEWSADGITKVLTDLRSVVGRRFYPDEDEPRAHQKKLCQACREGVCNS